MRTFLFALAALGALAIATPALAGHYQPVATPTVYHSSYNGAGYYALPATYASGYNNPYYGNQGHQNCNNNSNFNGYNGYNNYNGVRRGQVAHPGLHRGWFKHQPMHRRNAVRHNQNGFRTYGTPSHRHPGYWRQSDSDSRHDRNDNFDRRHDGHKQMKNQDHKNKSNNKNDNTRDHDGNSNRHARRHGG